MVTEASILTLWPWIKLLQFRVQYSWRLTNQMANQWTTHWLSKPEGFQGRFPLHWRKLKGPFYSVTKMQGEQINVLKTVLSLKTIHDYPILVSNLSVLQIMILLLRKDNTGRHFSWANQKKCWTYISWTLGNSHKNVTKALVLPYCMKFWRHLNLANLEKSSQKSCR